MTDNIDELRGYRHGNGMITRINLTDEQDDYERLAAAIAYYNSGTNLVGRTRRSWPSILKHLEYRADSTVNTGDICHSCRYSLEVREEIFGVDHLRTYIWAGDDANHDGQPDWCFGYGEEEWINPYTVTQRDGTTRNATFNDYQNRARASDEYQTLCN